MTNYAKLPGLVVALLCAIAMAAETPPSVQTLKSTPRKVARVVSLAPAATELTFALGAGNLVVGVTRYDDFPPSVTTLPKVGGFTDFDPEAVASLHPDLVIYTPTVGSQSRVDTLKRLHIPVLTVPSTTLSDLWDAMTMIGTAVGRPQEAEQLQQRVKAKLNALKEQHAAHGDKTKRVLWVVGHRPLVVAGPDSFLAQLLPFAGAINAVQKGPSFAVMDAEALLSINPDAIVDVSENQTVTPVWQGMTGLRAWPKGVYRLPPSPLVRPGPRLGEGLQQLTDALWRNTDPPPNSHHD